MGRYKKDASNLFNGFFKKPGVEIIRMEGFEGSSLSDEVFNIFYLDKSYENSYINISNITKKARIKSVDDFFYEFGIKNNNETDNFICKEKSYKKKDLQELFNGLFKDSRVKMEEINTFIKLTFLNQEYELKKSDIYKIIRTHKVKKVEDFFSNIKNPLKFFSRGELYSSSYQKDLTYLAFFEESNNIISPFLKPGATTSSRNGFRVSEIEDQFGKKVIKVIWINSDRIRLEALIKNRLDTYFYAKKIYNSTECFQLKYLPNLIGALRMAEGLIEGMSIEKEDWDFLENLSETMDVNLSRENAKTLRNEITAEI